MTTNLPAGDQQYTAELSEKPVSYSTRILSLDVLRGIAVLAALMVSIWVFGGFSSQQQKQLLLQSHGWNHRLYVAVELLFNGKMRAIIAIVFGASMLLFLHKDRTGKEPASDLFINRQLWLIIFGLINAFIFLWTQDILFHLGIMGLLLFPFIRLSNRGLLIAAILTTLIYCGKNYWNYSDHKKAYSKNIKLTALENKFKTDSIAKAKKGLIAKKDTLTKLQKQDKGEWEGILSSIKPDVKRDDATNKEMRNTSYGKVWNYLVPNIQQREAQWTYVAGIWDFACMIFLGMLLYRIGFFNNGFSRNKYLLLGLLCLTGGILFGIYRLHYQHVALEDYLKYIKYKALPFNFFFPLERALMALAYTSFVMACLSAGILRYIWKAFAAAGKLALTNYLLQSIICTVFFYGYGMGYYGMLKQWQLYFFALEVIIVQLAFSIIWLRYFEYGPAEWLLRRLSSSKWFRDPIQKPSSTGLPYSNVI
ncbi:MAG TPA: DUF418 domain-containing protein [Chitinophagaceae bacterium]|nr:DUF418 domain-containing protein [Chitinophagaceae bacterium]